MIDPEKDPDYYTKVDPSIWSVVALIAAAMIVVGVLVVSAL
jgi:hypothetical protein